jgi:predicted nucleic acid-binding protein
MPYLLDTNTVIALMKGHPAVKTPGLRCEDWMN